MLGIFSSTLENFPRNLLHGCDEHLKDVVGEGAESATVLLDPRKRRARKENEKFYAVIDENLSAELPRTRNSLDAEFPYEIQPSFNRF